VADEQASIDGYRGSAWTADGGNSCRAPSGQTPKSFLDDYPKCPAARQNSELVATVALENASSALWKFANSFTVSFTVTH
jgi:hypothetical protein